MHCQPCSEPSWTKLSVFSNVYFTCRVNLLAVVKMRNFSQNMVFLTNFCAKSATNSKQHIFWTIDHLQTCELTHYTICCNILVWSCYVFCALDAKRKQLWLFLSVCRSSRKCLLNFNVRKFSDFLLPPRKFAHELRRN